MKYRRKRMLIFSMVCLLGFTQAAGQPVWAASLDELEQQKQQTQQDAQDAKQDLEDAKDRTDSLQEEAEALEGEYRSLNSQLQSVAGQISDTEEAIATTSEDIDDLNAQLAEAQQKAREQYEAMKKRIQYMYENGNDSMLISILSSGSIAEFVKRAEYAYSIARYDQQMLEQYDQLQQDIAAKTAELQNKQTQLSSYQDTLSAKHQEMDTLVNNAGANLSAKNQEVSAAQMSEAEFEAKIAELEAYEKRLDEQIADEQLRLAQQIAQEEQESGQKEDTSGALEGYTQSDLTLMAAIIQAEADNQSYEGKLAVGSVVMNRVKSSKFPNTVSGVIYQKNQFAPVNDGHLALILERGPNETCYRAARQVLEGYRNVEYLFFWTVDLANERDIWDITYGVVIGDHYFYNYK
ncbi:MAG: cell wall hydrolase [Lachnospiraceae bacterium]